MERREISAILISRCRSSASAVTACRARICQPRLPSFLPVEGDTVDPHQKTMMVEGFVAAFAKAARVSDVPEEAIMSDTREPSYMFLAAEWNRSTVSECAQSLL